LTLWAGGGLKLLSVGPSWNMLTASIYNYNLYYYYISRATVLLGQSRLAISNENTAPLQ